jgi:hypothetical protein
MGRNYTIGDARSSCFSAVHPSVPAMDTRHHRPMPLYATCSPLLLLRRPSPRHLRPLLDRGGVFENRVTVDGALRPTLSPRQLVCARYERACVDYL